MTNRPSNPRLPRLLRFLLAAALLAAIFLPAAEAASARQGQEIPLQQGDEARLETFTLNAPQLREAERTIHVYLPPDYSTSGKSYPVIYLQDGAIMFSLTASNSCRVDVTLDELFASGQTQGIIAVGIRSSRNRWDEYSPWRNQQIHDWVDTQWGTEGGEGDAYLSFITDTLKPEIDSRYRTLPERQNTAIGGYSMGGLISLYAGLSRPEVFSMVLAVSPAVWFAETSDVWLAENALVNTINSIEVPKNVAVYMDIGTAEWEQSQSTAVDALGNLLSYPYVWVSGVQAAYNALQARQVPPANLLLVVDDGGTHDTSAWAPRFSKAIVWLFAERDYPDPTPTASPAQSTATPWAADPPGEPDINDRIAAAMPSIAVLGILFGVLVIFLAAWGRV